MDGMVVEYLQQLEPSPALSVVASHMSSVYALRILTRLCISCCSLMCRIMDFMSALHGVDELGPPGVAKMVSFMSRFYGVCKLNKDPNICPHAVVVCWC